MTYTSRQYSEKDEHKLMKAIIAQKKSYRYGACMGGPKTLKKLHFSEFFDVPKLNSGHCSNEYKRNTKTTPP
jgi:hypothetical protein